MAFFVDRRLARFTLVALLSEAPQELLAEGAKGRLSEELGHELVAVDFVRPLMFDGTPSLRNIPGFGLLY